MVEMPVEHRVSNLEMLMERVWESLDRTAWQVEQAHMRQEWLERQFEHERRQSRARQEQWERQFNASREEWDRRFEQAQGEFNARCERLERLVEQTTHNVDRLAQEMREFKDEMLAFKDEMREFKDEMLAFKDEMREFKDEMREFKDEMLAFKDEMREFKDEMHDFKQESRAMQARLEQSVKELNKKWGELANKMGTMADDLVSPSVPRILREVIGCPEGRVESMAVRVRRMHPTVRGREREFDVVAVCGEHVLINETRSTLTAKYVEEFVNRMADAREFFPEYADKKFIGAVASLHVDESVVRRGEKLGVLVLGFGEGVMDVLNSPGFTPKEF